MTKISLYFTVNGIFVSISFYVMLCNWLFLNFFSLLFSASNMADMSLYMTIPYVLIIILEITVQ